MNSTVVDWGLQSLGSTGSCDLRCAVLSILCFHVVSCCVASQASACAALCIARRQVAPAATAIVVEVDVACGSEAGRCNRFRTPKGFPCSIVCSLQFQRIGRPVGVRSAGEKALSLPKHARSQHPARCLATQPTVLLVLHLALHSCHQVLSQPEHAGISS